MNVQEVLLDWKYEFFQTIDACVAELQVPASVTVNMEI